MRPSIAADENNENFKALFETMDMGVVFQDAEGIIINANPFAERILGITLDQMQGRTSMHPEWKSIAEDGSDLPGEKHPAMLALRTRKNVSNFLQGIYNPNNKDYTWILVNSVPLFLKGNMEPYQVYSTFVDFTEHKKADEQLKATNQQLLANEQQLRAANQQLKASEKELLESEFKLKYIIENSTNLFYSHTAEHKITYISPQVREILQYEPEDVMHSWTEFITDNPINEAAVKSTEDAIKTGKRQPSYECEMTRKDGKIILVEVREAPVVLNGEVVSIVGSLCDITERKKAEEKLTHSRDLMRYIIEHNKSAVAVHDRELNYIYVSQDYLKQYKVKQKDVIGKHHYEIFPDLPQKWRDVHKKALAGEISRSDEDPYEKDDGTIEWTRWECRPWFDTDGSIGGIIIYTEVITERKKAEEQLKALNQQLHASEQQLRATNQQLRANEQALIGAVENAEESANQLKLISDNFVNGMIYQVVSLDGNERRFNYISEAVNVLYGCTPGQAMENPDLIYSKVHPDDIHLLIAKEEEAIRSMAVFKVETRVINPDGTIRWSYFISKPRMIDGFICWDGIELDITEKMKLITDLGLAKEKAEESDKLKSAFLANMSHEIRTPMNGILGFTSLLKEADLTGEEREKYIDIIEKSGDRMLNTINDIIDISRIESGEVMVTAKSTNINTQLDSLFEFFKPEANKKNLHLEINPGLDNKASEIQTDPEKLYAILVNLIKNAIKYTQEGFVECGYILVKNKIQFYVKDTGEGIKSDSLKSIFERFIQEDIYDTNAKQGSGLGLAIVKAYVELLEGEIWVESVKGKGSSFLFTIPYNPVEKELNPSKPILKERVGKINTLANKTILIAEDDETSSEYLEIVIRSFGVKNILFAKDGKESVRLCKENPSIDLVLMDINMPVMSGYDATKAIRMFNKDLPIISQTAYALSGDRKKSIEAGCNDYIIKPIEKDVLYEKFERFLINA